MQFLGIDLGSSSVKVSVLEGDSGACVDTISYPEKELTIDAPKNGWAEQNPEIWWDCVVAAIEKLYSHGKMKAGSIGGIGIAYQMHGLVAVDKNRKPVRPAIIWCDSRAVENGNRLFMETGREKCMDRLLNSPGNFTLSKLLWVKKNEPEIFDRIYKFMLPGDYIAMRLTGEIMTTVSGLSEGILWDFKEQQTAGFLLKAADIEAGLTPDIVPTFGLQGSLSKTAAKALRLPSGIPVTYRAGDQPNNAFSLNVLNPGETAATAGTSGVVYGVTDRLQSDPLSHVNTFAHVNHASEIPRLGVLLCINGTGIANSWIRKITASSGFEEMDQNATEIPPGSEGLLFLPFGNGAERMLQNANIGAAFQNIDFIKHNRKHLLRAVQEGVAFAFHNGMEIMKESGMFTQVIRAGRNNMFLSDVFCETLSTITGTNIELYNTDGSLGAARGAAHGAGFYKSLPECFTGLEKIKVAEPDFSVKNRLDEVYEKWKALLNLQSNRANAKF